MAQLFSTTAVTATSAVLTPSDDFSVQVRWPVPPPRIGVVDVQARADAAAPWVSIGGISINDFPPLARFAKQSAVQVVLSGNDGGGLVTTWSDI